MSLSFSRFSERLSTGLPASYPVHHTSVLLCKSTLPTRLHPEYTHLCNKAGRISFIVEKDSFLRSFSRIKITFFSCGSHVVVNCVVVEFSCLQGSSLKPTSGSVGAVAVNTNKLIFLTTIPRTPRPVFSCTILVNQLRQMVSKPHLFL